MTTSSGHSPAGDNPRPDPTIALGAMRIGDTERTSALDALAEHLTAGRVTLDEYGERTAKVTVARTVDEMMELFEDLPAPHPTLSHGTAPAAAASGPRSAAMSRAAARSPERLAAGAGSALASADRRSRAQIIVAAAASASVFVALALFFITGTWLWFLLIPAISGVAKAVWGSEWNQPGRDRPNPRELGGR